MIAPQETASITSLLGDKPKKNEDIGPAQEQDVNTVSETSIPDKNNGVDLREDFKPGEETSGQLLENTPSQHFVYMELATCIPECVQGAPYFFLVTR